MRDFPAIFKGALQSATQYGAPYSILEIQWGGETGTLYYLDRNYGEFSSGGIRTPASNLIGGPKVVEWGTITCSLRETEIGYAERTSVKLFDARHEIYAITLLEAKQRKRVKIWRMFDVDGVYWPSGAALIFDGSLRPFDWVEEGNEITLNFEDASGRLVKEVEILARRNLFGPRLPEESRDKQLPIVWGRAHRVPALLVHEPWEVTTAEPVPEFGEAEIAIFEHPDEVGAPITDDEEPPIEVWLGTDLVQGYFTQSQDRENEPSTFTILDSDGPTVCQALLSYVTGTSKQRYGVIWSQLIGPRAYQHRLQDVAVAGYPVLVYILDSRAPQQGWVAGHVESLAIDEPWKDYYKITFQEDDTINPFLKSGTLVKFIDTTADRRAWPAGTPIRPKDDDLIYVANAFRSKHVIKVEGFGKVTDEAGERDDFLAIGKAYNENLLIDPSSSDLPASTWSPSALTDFDFFSVELNDSTWSASGWREDGIGHAVTTLRFPIRPRGIHPAITTDRLWVTMLGNVEDDGETLIENPARVIERYLTHRHMLNVPSEFIEPNSFGLAKTRMEGRSVGFAQLDAMDGLELIQQIAAQCHSILFFDQGKAHLAVMSNTGATGTLRFGYGGGVDNWIERSLSIAESPVDDVVSRVTGHWRKYWDDVTGNKTRKVTAVGTNAEAAFGKNEVEMPIWAYWRRTDVKEEVAWWTNRWAKIYTHVNFTSRLDASILQPADWIKLYFTEYEGYRFFNGTNAEVLSVSDLGNGLVTVHCRAIRHDFSGVEDEYEGFVDPSTSSAPSESSFPSSASSSVPSVPSSSASSEPSSTPSSEPSSEPSSTPSSESEPSSSTPSEPSSSSDEEPPTLVCTGTCLEGMGPTEGQSLLVVVRGTVGTSGAGGGDDCNQSQCADAVLGTYAIPQRSPGSCSWSMSFPTNFPGAWCGDRVIIEGGIELPGRYRINVVIRRFLNENVSAAVFHAPVVDGNCLTPHIGLTPVSTGALPGPAPNSDSCVLSGLILDIYPTG